MAECRARRGQKKFLSDKQTSQIWVGGNEEEEEGEKNLLGLKNKSGEEGGSLQSDVVVVSSL